LWEDVVIILSIFSVWPAILKRENITTRIVMLVAFGILIWVLIRRVRRFKNLDK